MQGATLARLLSKANVSESAQPLEALVCDAHGLTSVPDYPLAPIAANADGLAVGEAYWLRVDPAHLMLQRDSFSLDEPLPLQLEHAHAASIIASLNQHFSRDDLNFVIGNSGAWYLRMNQPPQIRTTLPAVALGRNVYSFMPQGADAAAWVSYLNEVQMLLHEHPVNLAREAAGEAAVNSVWLSGGGVMPQHPAISIADMDMIVSNSVFYRGLAAWQGVPNQAAAEHVTDMLQNLKMHSHVRMELPAQQLLDDSCFQALWDALKTGTIKQLTLNLGWYEKTLVATIQPIDIYKLWRKNKPISTFLT